MKDIDEAIHAFEVGDYARARRYAERVLAAKPAKPANAAYREPDAARDEDAEDTSADDATIARDLLRRTSPPRAAKYFFLLAAALLALLCVYWTEQSHEAPNAPPTSTAPSR